MSPSPDDFLMKDPLDAFLREQLSISDAAIESLTHGTQRAAEARWAPGWRSLHWAASIACAAAAAALLWTPPNLDDVPSGERATAVMSAGDHHRSGDSGEGTPGGVSTAGGLLIPIHRDPKSGGESNYDDPRRLGNLLRAADLIVVGEVIALDGGVRSLESGKEDAHFQIEAVLLGELSDPSAPLTLRDHDGPTWFACAETLRLEPGRRTVMFLVEDAERSGRYEVLFGDAGNNPLPMDGWFDVDDLRGIIETGTVPPSRVIQWMDQQGFRIVTALPWDFYDLDGLALPLEHPSIQEALATRLSRTDLATIETGDLCLIIDALSPKTIAAMPEPVRQALRDQLPRVLDGVNGPFRAVHLLRPFAIRKEPWAYPHIRALIDSLVERLSAAPRADWAAAHHRELIALLYHLDPADAIRRAWECVERLPDTGYESSARVLEVLLTWDRQRAEARVLRTAQKQWLAGERVWIDLLLRCEDPTARTLLLKILRSADYDPSRRYGLWRPDLHEVIGTHDLDVTDLRTLFGDRVKQPASGIEDFLDRFLCSLAAGEDPASREILAPWIARSSQLERHELRRLIRAIERASSDRILRRPVATRNEMEAWLAEWWQ